MRTLYTLLIAIPLLVTLSGVADASTPYTPPLPNIDSFFQCYAANVGSRAREVEITVVRQDGSIHSSTSELLEPGETLASPSVGDCVGGCCCPTPEGCTVCYCEIQTRGGKEKIRASAISTNVVGEKIAVSAD